MKDVEIPPFSDKDLQAFEIGSNLGIKNYALSFASDGKYVDKIRSLVPEGSFIISKIESISGLKNLLKITDKSDAILIDRGDLSRELSLEKYPFFKINIKTAINKEVFVATNLLESMIDSPSHRAEIMIYNTLLDGATGLVLAAETAIGKYPVQSAVIAKSLINCYKFFKNNNDLNFADEKQIIKIIEKNIK